MREIATGAVRQMHSRSIKTLVIDVRDNPGGNSKVPNPIVDVLARHRIRKWSWKLKYSRMIMLRGEYHFPEAKLGDWVDASKQDGRWYYQPQGTTKFEGQTVVLSNRESYSSANWVVYLLRDNDLATVVGEAPGNGGCTFGDWRSFYLPHSGVEVGYSYKIFERPRSELCKTAPNLTPDFSVKQTLADYLQGRDSVMEFVYRQFSPKQRPP